jgi:hypothetical protein
MPVRRVIQGFVVRGRRRTGAVAAAVCLLWIPAEAQAQALNFFKNYFVTGNYVTGGIDFGSQSGGGGVVTAEIHFGSSYENEVPANADIVAAILYWQTISTTGTVSPAAGATFRGEDISGRAKEVKSVALQSTFAPCWTSGGGSGATYKMQTLRADVLRDLPIPTDPETGAPVGKRLINDDDLLAHGFPLHTVTLPDSGTGNQVPQTAGATLVVIYRDPSESLKAVVLYDGLHIKAPGTTPVTQMLQGFYEAAAPDPGHPLAAQMTYMVGSGAPNGTEYITFNDAPIATDPFITVNSSSSQRGWDFTTFDVSSHMTGLNWSQKGQEVSLSVNHTNGSPYDCLATSAIVLSTTVKDTDFDALLDIWETGYPASPPAQAEALLDPAGIALPPLHKMGANKDVQDIFVEVGYMRAQAGTPYGGIPDPAGHNHLPSQAVLASVVSVFQNAGPRRNPANTTQQLAGPIKVHFDVGNRYQTLANVVPSAHARGGEEVIETACVPNPGTEDGCAFADWAGTVGWKLGFRIIRDAPLNQPNELACQQAGLACLRRFDENRRHMFRYAFFTHALGIQDPLKAEGTPRSVSGVSDAGNGGGDFMVTLGLWDNYTGTPFMQTSTIVHELGHTLGLRHGGSAPTPANPAPNCKPNYESVMNYLFQVRGLIGVSSPEVGLSGQVLGNLNEGTLSETALTALTNGPVKYPTRWYAQLAGSYLDTLVGTTAATRHCDGTILHADPQDPEYNPADTIPMVRVDGTYPIGAIDWNANGTLSPGDGIPNGFSQDVNFNGTTNGATNDGLLAGFNDWLNVDLRQTASRRNPASLSLEISLDDLSAGDPGYGDPGYGDPGYGDPGYGDPGYGDPGYGDPGYGDPGYGDPGYGGDLDKPQAESLGNAPNSLTFTTTNQSINLKWTAPHVGAVTVYRVWRALGTISPSNLPTQVSPPGGIAPGTVCNAATGAIFCDFSTQNNRVYQYFVTADFVNVTKSGKSNTITASR